jgi:putative Holliday junction resolvase
MTSDKQPFCTSIGELSGKLKTGQRLMGLDVGEKTIGMAVSDALLSIATPHDTIRRSKFSKDLEALQKVVKDRNVGGFVIGYPINMNGTEGPRCQSTRQFARNIYEKLALPCFLWDERMSSLAVERMMTEGGLSRNRKAELVDKLAASYILQGALDCLP